MTHVKLTHGTRPDLDFRQVQRDEVQRDAVANVTNELGVDRLTLVHTETREIERAIRGLVTGPRRAANDANTSDWEQALANYADVLESHVDEFQGTGYTLDDSHLGVTKNAVLESVGWELTPGRPYEFEFDARVLIGRGTYEDRDISRRNPTVDTSMSVMAKVDGNDLPNFRTIKMERSVGVDPTPVFDRDSAENNDIVMEGGIQQRFIIEGVHTGSESTRESADTTLRGLVGTKNNVTLETRFPGYDLNGYVLNYDSNLEQRFGTRSHRYRLEFIEGERA